MHNLLNKIQRLPETQRKILAILTMAIIAPLVFYVFTGVFKNNLNSIQEFAVRQENNEIQNQESQLEPGVSPVDWIVQSTSILKSNGIDFLITLLEATGNLADNVAVAESKLLPGFNDFLAGILNSAKFWK